MDSGWLTRRWRGLARSEAMSGPLVDGYVLRRLAYLGSRYGPEPLIRYSPAFWGLLFGLALPERRRRVRENLRRVRGARRRLAEEVDALRTFVRYAHCLAESLGADRAPERVTTPRLVGEEHLVAALEGGRGVVLVTAHTGIWDLAARALVERLQGDVAVVMQPEADPRARALQDALRARRGVSIVHVAHPLDGMTLLRRLRAGSAVALQLDRVPPSMRALTVDLFGVPFRVPEGPFQLAATAQAPVVPVFARRCGYFDYEIAMGPAQSLSRRPSSGELRGAAQAIVDELARFVRAHPNDWFHFEEG